MLFQFSAIKEAARQISELDQEDYSILEKYYSLSIRNCDISLDIYEPIALQLPALIEQLGVEGQGASTSDSGALSDYESSACETDELSNSSSVTIRADDTRSMPIHTHQSETAIEDLSCDNVHSSVEGSNTAITPSPAELSASENNLSPYEQDQDYNVDNGSEMEEFWAIIKEANNGNEEVSLPHLQDHEEELQSGCTEIIMVTDLEKEFFSDTFQDISPKELTSQQEHLGEDNTQTPRGYREKRFNNTRGEAKGQSKWGSPNRGGRYYSQRGDYRGRSRGGFRPRFARDKCEVTENDSTTQSPNGHRASRRTEECDQRVSAREAKQTDANGEKNYSPKLDTEGLEKKVKFGAISHHPSPLVVHSQNMWSSKIDTVKSCKAKRVTFTHKQHRSENSHSTFNHYEVGCFLMEGIV